jgi:hypothetical protein
LDDLGAYDERAVFGTEPTINASQSLAGTVSTTATATAAAALVEGTKVTVSGAGLQFLSVVDSADVYTLDSATVYTDASGAFDVSVASNKAGKQTIKITAGAVTQTVTVVFEEAKNDTATTITIAAAPLVKAGRTLAIVGTLTDKYGNPVSLADAEGTDSSATAGNIDFGVTYDGPGYVMNTPTSTDANGKFTLRVLLGSDEVGLGTVSVTYDPAESVADNTITKSSTTMIGVSAGARGEVKAVSSLVKNATGLTIKIVRGAKVVTAVATSDSYRISITEIKPGKRDVKVYVNDVLVNSKTVTVKR